MSAVLFLRFKSIAREHTMIDIPQKAKHQPIPIFVNTEEAKNETT